MTEPKYVDARQLRPGPIRHESLPPDLLEYIEAVYHVIGKMALNNLEAVQRRHQDVQQERGLTPDHPHTCCH